jgi:hypothetical protein
LDAVDAEPAAAGSGAGKTSGPFCPQPAKPETRAKPASSKETTAVTVIALAPTLVLAIGMQ